MSTPNPYDVNDGGCRCAAWSEGECACGRYVDPAWKRIWQRGYEVGRSDALTEAANDPALRLSGHSGISIRRLRALAALTTETDPNGASEWEADA